MVMLSLNDKTAKAVMFVEKAFVPVSVMNGTFAFFVVLVPAVATILASVDVLPLVVTAPVNVVVDVVACSGASVLVTMAAAYALTVFIMVVVLDTFAARLVSAVVVSVAVIARSIVTLATDLVALMLVIALSASSEICPLK